MNKMKINKVRFLFIFLFAFTLAIPMLSFISNNKLSIDGVWSVVEVQTILPDGKSASTFPKESHVIFSNPYYSFCWTNNITNVRKWQMDDSAKLNRFNQSIVNAGVFELNDSILTTKATFAMNPMFVNGLATFKCSFNRDTLILAGLSVVSSDNISHPAYAQGSHFVSKLLRVRKSEN